MILTTLMSDVRQNRCNWLLTINSYLGTKVVQSKAWSADLPRRAIVKEDLVHKIMTSRDYVGKVPND